MFKLIAFLLLAGVGGNGASDSVVETSAPEPTVEKVVVSSEIEFFHGSWKEALAQAKAEGKMIFFDAYTSWCTPCKVMARRTFTNKEVAKYFNENFINVKVDMEKGEGPMLDSKFKVTHYPTLLIVNPKGKEIGRSVGLLDPSELLAFGKQYVD